MTRFYLRRAQLSLIACVLLLASCQKKDAALTDTTKVPPTVATAMPGALTKPLDAYSGDELYDFVRKLSFTGGHERDRRCKNATGCEGALATRRTKVQIDAVARQDSIAPSNAGQFGVLYIRALNKGDAEEARYSLKPGANFEYFVIVSADSAGAMRWRFEQLDTTEKARRHSQIGSGVFAGCNHKWIAGAAADFKTCEMARGAARNDSTVQLGLVLQAGDVEPAWAACSMGCCIAQ